VAQRSRADKVEDGRKANTRKVEQFGPDEPNRAARQAAWKKQHSGRNKAENPHVREQIYSPADFGRVKNFDARAKEHPNQRHAENPFSWDKRFA
jgi:hypothetical protein